MPKIELPEDVLVRNRPRAVRELLASLRTTNVIPSRWVKRKYLGARVISAHQGGESEEDFEQWYFQTYVPDIWCQYFELWKPIANRREYFLDRAYLHLAVTNRAEHSLKEIVALHCDPDDNSSEPTRSYKRGPHLHITCAPDPLHRSHLPLNLTELSAVLESADELTNAMARAVEVLSNEVLRRFERKPC